MPELETGEPALPGDMYIRGEDLRDGHTRGDDLRDIVEKLQNHAHLCVDNQDFEPAQMIISAAQLIVDAETKLAESGEADEPYQQSAHTRAGG